VHDRWYEGVSAMSPLLSRPKAEFTNRESHTSTEIKINTLRTKRRISYMRQVAPFSKLHVIVKNGWAGWDDRNDGQSLMEIRQHSESSMHALMISHMRCRP